jgi:outer membrane protein assembly factor BamB
MNKKFAFLVWIIIFYGCKKTETTSGGGGTPNPQHISVVTQHNDNTRAGLNSNEIKLTTANVNPQQFGQLFSLAVDDQIYSQPLVVGNLSIGSGIHNVVFIATVNNSVYAFDADNGKSYWNNNYTTAGKRPPNIGDMSSGWCTPYGDFASNIGIVGTPVIDTTTQTIYFVARSTDGISFTQSLHAVNIVNGNEQPGSPVTITASVPGTGDGNVAGMVSFDPRRNNQRQGLALVNGVVYISFSSHCDWNPFHGWILGYNAQSLQQQIIYNDTPSGEDGGIWESGQGVAADEQGNLYVVTGNGTVGQGNLYTGTGNGTSENNPNPNPADPTNRGESALKLTPSGSSLQIGSYFTPTNYLNLNINDQDYGVMGTMLIPNSNFYLTGCKDGNLYLLDRDNMGGYSNSSNQVQQTIPLNVTLHCQPTYWKGSTNEFVYVWSENDQLRALSFNRGNNTFANTQIVSTVNGPTGGVGADLSASSNGSVDGTGILWASYATGSDWIHTSSPGILRAFDANDITKELWNSNQNASDNVGNYAKFSPPTVANGHVYLATFSNKVVVYGLR